MRWSVVALAVMLAGCSGGSPSAEEPVAGEDAPEGEPIRAPSKVRDADRLNETVVTKSYTGYGAGPFALNTGCGGLFFDPGGPENVGGACFQLPPDTERVEFSAQDDVSGSVGLYIRYDGSSEGFACTQGSLSPPASPWVMFVVSETGCLGQVPPATPTAGEITVTLYHPDA